jgi:hypothetical protein
VTEPRERTIEHAGSFDTLPDSACRPHTREAERLGLFGPVDPAASKPTTSSGDRDSDCRTGPAPDDIRRGCRYELPSSARRSPAAPDVAPVELHP